MHTGRLDLPDVTLVMVETREHHLAKMAIADCLAVADFAEVLILTDKPEKFDGLVHVPRFEIVPDYPHKLGWSMTWWFDVARLLRTQQSLNIQWDSWIIDPDMWRDEFLEYDYIGSPWWHTDGMNVGNGGFSMVSRQLKRHIYNNRDRYPCTTPSDDALLCRVYRPYLEAEGFVWAPASVAQDFAFERTRPSIASRHFGFHGTFNWPFVLPPKALHERIKIAEQSPYISKTNMLKELETLRKSCWQKIYSPMEELSNVG